MKPEILRQVIKHGENLGRIFPAVRGLEPVKLCRQLRRIEMEAEKAIENYEMGRGTLEQRDQLTQRATDKLNKILRFTQAGVKVFVNLDPRGYAFKISDDWLKANGRPMIHTDMGGYGIIAPEFKADGE